MREHRKFDINEWSTEDALYFFGWIFLPIGLIVTYAVVKWLVPHIHGSCIFWELFGIYCPGCGGTRSLLALSQGHILQSLWYHPLLLYCVGMYLVFMLSHTLEKLHVPFVKGMKFKEWILYGMLIVLVLNCVVKNVLKIKFGIIMY